MERNHCLECLFGEFLTFLSHKVKDIMGKIGEVGRELKLPDYLRFVLFCPEDCICSVSSNAKEGPDHS